MSGDAWPRHTVPVGGANGSRYTKVRLLATSRGRVRYTALELLGLGVLRAVAPQGALGTEAWWSE